MLATWVINPLIMYPVYSMTYEFGRFLLAREPHPLDFELSFAWLADGFSHVWEPLILGSLMLGLLTNHWFIASLLVLVSVMAAGRSRQVYEATVLHSIGTRMAVIRRSLHMEYVLLAVITSTLAVLLGAAIAMPLLKRMSSASISALGTTGIIRARATWISGLLVCTTCVVIRSCSALLSHSGQHQG